MLTPIDSGMVVRYATSDDEIEAINNELTAKGLRLASVSNTGLHPGTVRLTFLPKSAFVEKHAHD